MTGISTQQGSKGGNTRKFAILAGSILLAILAYTGLWYYLADRIDRQAAAVLADLSREGFRAVCAGQQVEGYPFRLGLHCTSIDFEDSRRGIAFTAGELRTAAQVYRPKLVNAELAGGGRLTLPGLGEVLLDWQQGRASVRLARPLPERVSVVMRDVTGTTAATSALFEADAAQLHLRPNGSDLDLAASLDALQVVKGDGEMGSAFGLLIDATVAEGVRWLGAPDGSLRGRNAVFRQVRLDLGDEGRAEASGTIAVRGDGLVDADLTLQIVNARNVGAVLAELLPGAAPSIRMAADNLAFLGDGAEIPVRIEAGRIFVGPFEVGALLPLP